MKATLFVPALATALLFSTAAMAGEFGNYCAMNLAEGKKVKTDCSINAMIGGKEYCFFDTAAKTKFMKEPKVLLAKASDFYQTFGES
jgi:hypothetical protein